MRQGEEAYRDGIRQVIDPAAVRAGIVAGDHIVGELQAGFGLHSYVVDPATIFRAVSPDGSAGYHRRIFAAEDKEPAARAGVIAENPAVLDGGEIAVGDSAAYAASPIAVDQVAGEQSATLCRVDDGAASSRRGVPVESRVGHGGAAGVGVVIDGAAVAGRRVPGEGCAIHLGAGTRAGVGDGPRALVPAEEPAVDGQHAGTREVDRGDAVAEVQVADSQPALVNLDDRELRRTRSGAALQGGPVTHDAEILGDGGQPCGQAVRAPGRQGQGGAVAGAAQRRGQGGGAARHGNDLRRGRLRGGAGCQAGRHQRGYRGGPGRYFCGFCTHIRLAPA